MTAPASRTRPRGEPPPPAALPAGGSPREVLALLVQDDPLGIRARVRERLERDRLLLDAEDVVLRVQALCAWHARDGRAAPDLERWVDLRVEEALEAVLAAAEPGEAVRALAAPLGLDPRALAAACARFARLAPELRDAFFAVVLAGGGADRAARARGLSLTELARRARAALEAFRPLGRTEGPPWGSP